MLLPKFGAALLALGVVLAWIGRRDAKARRS
jgi:hypothetical protein